MHFINRQAINRSVFKGLSFCVTLIQLSLISLVTAGAAGPFDNKEIPNANVNASNVKITEAVNDPAFHKALLKVAEEYKSYGRVDNDLRNAPALCLPPKIGPAPPKLSLSGDASTHGQKVYYLYAKDRPGYLKLEDPNVPQTIVKESWTPKLDAAGMKTNAPDKMHALFIMMKLDGSTPNTDAGWVYGTVTPDGKTVSSAGKVQSCMGCHSQAPYGKLFGIKRSRFE